MNSLEIISSEAGRLRKKTSSSKQRDFSFKQTRETLPKECFLEEGFIVTVSKKCPDSIFITTGPQRHWSSEFKSSFHFPDFKKFPF